MPRTIPIYLEGHIASGATTLCLLMKVTPVQPGYAPFGVTGLDHDIMYDDGTGELLYSAAIGSDPSALVSAADLSVAGGNAKQLMPIFETPITEAQLMAGACDYAEFAVYEINYNDLTSGHHIIIQTGTMGAQSITDSGLSWTSELRGLTQPLKQSITEKYSLTCRAVFGSTGTSAQSRFPCNFDISTLWQDSTVTLVGGDNQQSFNCANFTPTYGGQPGLVEWLTGANAGRSDEVESFDDTALGPGLPGETVTIGLTFGSAYAIQVGDTFRFRDDCPKTPTACQARSNFQNYRGEPSIPVADNGALSVGNIGGSVTTTTDDGG